MTPRRISASRMPPFLRVKRAARRSEVLVKGMARMYPTRDAIEIRPELIWGQLYGSTVILSGNMKLNVRAPRPI